jgi:hypothetical protein
MLKSVNTKVGEFIEFNGKPFISIDSGIFSTIVINTNSDRTSIE